MAKQENSISKIIPTILIVALAIYGFVVHQEDRSREQTILTNFTDKRLEIVHLGLASLRQVVEDEYSKLLTDCENRSQYDNFIDTDSRTMTAVELKEAMNLHDECGLYFANKTTLTLGFYEQMISELSDGATLIREGKNKDNALQIASFWDKIFELESEHSTIYNRMVSIQGSYWKEDLNKAIKLSSSEEREANVGALNYEANQKLERIREIGEELKRFRLAESEFWNKSFATSTSER